MSHILPPLWYGLCFSAVTAAVFCAQKPCIGSELLCFCIDCYWSIEMQPTSKELLQLEVYHSTSFMGTQFHILPSYLIRERFHSDQLLKKGQAHPDGKPAVGQFPKGHCSVSFTTGHNEDPQSQFISQFHPLVEDEFLKIVYKLIFQELDGN